MEQYKGIVINRKTIYNPQLGYYDLTPPIEGVLPNEVDFVILQQKGNKVSAMVINSNERYFTAQNMIDFGQHLLKDHSTQEVTLSDLNDFLNIK